MASFSFHLKDPKSENETHIRLHVNYGPNRLKVYTGEKIHPSNWDVSTKRARRSRKDFSEFPEFNSKLDDIEAKAKDVFRRYQNDNDQQTPPPAHLRKLIEIAIKRRDAEPEKMDFFTYFSNYIRNQKIRCDNEKRAYRDSIVKSYERSYDLLQEFSKIRRVEFEAITKDFYFSYMEFLRKKKGFRNNSIGNHVKRLKTVLNSATEEGYNKTLIFRSRDFKVLSEKTENFYLDEQELLILGSLDLDQTPGLERARDLFLLGAWTGLRSSDLNRLTGDHINYENEIITIEMKKTGATVSIPFLPEAKRIIEKYKGEGLPTFSNQVFNRHLKTLGEKLSKKIGELQITGERKGKDFSNLTSHTGRRSFCSNMYARRIDPERIMVISGHKTKSEFFKYIKVSPEDRVKMFMDDFNKSMDNTSEQSNLKIVS